jgi:hypothetical protein
MKTLSFRTVLFAVAVIGPDLMLASPGRQVLAQEPDARRVANRNTPHSKAADTPRVTTAPRNLIATPGRGDAVLFAVDEKGDRIVQMPPLLLQRANAGRPDETPVAYKEEVRHLRWAVVVGTLDFRAIREARLGKDGRNAELERQLCKRIDIQRQTRNPDGTWTDWNDIDSDANYKVLDSITEVAKERTKPDVYLEAVVDPLPLLKSGEWRGVDVPAFLDPNAEKAPTIFGFPVGHASLPLPADEIMVRCLDFTVQPGASYRYRARVVLSDVAQRDDIFGPWSEATGPVTIPKE